MLFYFFWPIGSVRSIYYYPTGHQKLKKKKEVACFSIFMEMELTFCTNLKHAHKTFFLQPFYLQPWELKYTCYPTRVF